MNQIDERQRSINAKIDRLRKRVKDGKIDPKVAAMLLGLLDLLEDEL